MDDDGWSLIERLEVSTHDVAEAEEFVRRTYPGRHTRFHGGADSHATIAITAAQTSRITADDVRSTVDYSTASDPRHDFRSNVLYHGRLQIRHGRDETTCSVGETCLYPMGVPLDLELSDLGVRTMRLPMEPLEEAAEEAVGIDAADLRFESSLPISASAARRWSAFVELAGTLLMDQTVTAPPIMVEELTHSAATIALHTFPNTALTAPYLSRPGWVAESAARRAAAFIQAHAGDALTVKEIAAAAGVGARALQQAFRRYFDTTPTGYLRQVRLERVRDELRDTDPTDAAALEQVARRWGWTSARRLTAAYQQRFGELPGH